MRSEKLTSADSHLRGMVEYKSQFKFEKWYDILSSCTIPTEIVPLTKDDALKMIRVYNTKILEVEDLNELKGKLDAAIQKFNGVAFVKLSTRSPKDVVEDNIALLEELLIKNLTALKMTTGDIKPTENEQLIAYMKSVHESLSVKNGDSALVLLTLSERIYTDLDQFLEALTETENFDMHLIVRKWIPEITPDTEFRVFVHEKKK